MATNTNAMNANTAKALSLIPAAPLTVGTTASDYCQSQEPRDTRAIFNRKGQDLLYVTATSTLDYSGEPMEENNPWRVEAAAVLSTLWAKSPELLAALDGLLEFAETLRTGDKPAWPLGGTPMPLSYARRVRDEIVAAMLAAPENPRPTAETATPVQE